MQDLIDNNEEVKKKVKPYQIKSDNIFNHMMEMIRTVPKYVASQACSDNIDLYFKYQKKIDEIYKYHFFLNK